MFSCNYREIFKKTYFEKHLRTAAYVYFKIKRRIQNPVVKYLNVFARSCLRWCLTVQNTSLEKRLLQGWTNFFLGANFLDAQFYLYTQSGTQKMAGQKQIVRPIERQLIFVVSEHIQHLLQLIFVISELIFTQALMVKRNFSVKTPPVPYLSLLNILVSKREIN